HTSGHYYFSLKDDKSQISAVMFRGFNSKLRFKLVDGLEVLVKGRISVYEPRGSYQILCEAMEPVGAGALQKAFEELKQKLKAEGLFDSARKRSIPTLPQKVVLVTSPTGAAIQDMRQIITRRAPYLEVILIPTLVQGEGAAEKITEALKKAWLLKNVDVIIVGRGGGSIEDLWAFNDENLARAIAASPVPVISAVGHEIDFTIADFVADLRAPTPSAAAELVAKSAKELTERLVSVNRMLNMILERQFKKWDQRLENLKIRLIDPKKKLQDLILKNDDLFNRLEKALDRKILTYKHKAELLLQKLKDPAVKIKLASEEVHFLHKTLIAKIQELLKAKQIDVKNKMQLLDSFSPLKVVERGYVIVTKDDQVIKERSQLAEEDQIQLRFADGPLQVKIKELKLK
ncbi:MAG: exodeoxyribonuclease VII large subunit, partial [Bacteriovoracaceae bacterium]|nr:exodeoxyribonuclease VII large subunit [Bacteriovoracaceae bacterium]